MPIFGSNESDFAPPRSSEFPLDAFALAARFVVQMLASDDPRCAHDENPKPVSAYQRAASLVDIPELRRTAALRETCRRRHGLEWNGEPAERARLQRRVDHEARLRSGICERFAREPIDEERQSQRSSPEITAWPSGT